MFPVFKTVVCGEGLSEIKTIDSTFDSGRMKKISNKIEGEASWEFLIF
jgi:hypothetical protein